MTGADDVGRGAASIAAARLLIQSGNEVEGVTTGDSMSPAILAHSEIRVRPADPAKLGRGDVVAFVRDTTLVAHRAVALVPTRNQTTYVVTRGDAMTICDVPVPVSDLLGIVTEVNYRDVWSPPRGAVRLRGWRATLSVMIERLVVAALRTDAELAAAIVRTANAAARMRAPFARRPA